MKALHEYMKYTKTYLVNDQSLSNTNNVHNEAYELQKRKEYVWSIIQMLCYQWLSNIYPITLFSHENYMVDALTTLQNNKFVINLSLPIPSSIEWLTT